MHSMPAICGIVRSMVTMSGSVFLNISSASTPLPAVPTTSSSSNCCERSIRRRMMLESSTISSLSDRLPPASLPCTMPIRVLPSLLSSGDRRARRFRGGQHDLEAGEAARVRAHPDLAAQPVYSARHDVHADASAGIHGDLLLGGESRPEDEGHGRTRIHRSRFLGRDDVLAHSGILQYLRRDAGAVILEHQLIAVARAAKVDTYRADIRLRQGTARLAGLDPVDRGVA